MSINDRIADLIYDLKDNENLFAKRIGVSTSVVFNIVNPKGRKSYPSGPVLEKILSIEKDGNRVSAEWLMRGEGGIFQVEKDFLPDGTEEIYKTIEELSSSLLKLREGFENFKKGR